MGSATCDFCHSKPKFVEGGKTHPYCGKTCAGKAKAKAGVQHPQGGGCAIPGCPKAPFVDATGKASPYCGVTHKELAKNACLMCRKAPRNGHHPWCGRTCGAKAESQATLLLEVPNIHTTFKDVEAQFKASWRNPSSPPPEVKNIYKVVESSASRANYDKYRASVEARGNFVAKGRSAGNECRRWHGTVRECHVGEPGQGQLCGSATCRLCTIMKTSFILSAAGKNYATLRFGAGIYTSSTSATSNGYSRNTQASPVKALLLNKVVVGRCLKDGTSNTGLTAAPAGYDSVVATANAWGGDDELIVYSNDAVRPSYLIMYAA